MLKNGSPIKRSIFSGLTGLGLGVALGGPAGLSAASEQAAPEPPPPQPSAAVQPILEEAARLAEAKQPEAALTAGDRAVSVAREMNDPVGEAQAHRARALALQRLSRS